MTDEKPTPQDVAADAATAETPPPPAVGDHAPAGRSARLRDGVRARLGRRPAGRTAAALVAAAALLVGGAGGFAVAAATDGPGERPGGGGHASYDGRGPGGQHGGPHR